jgi:hypothetical protein
MQLIQILLPLCDNGGRRFPPGKFQQVKAVLSEKFKGLTAYNRSAAEGIWKKGAALRRDDIVVYEVMAPSLNRRWWKSYQKSLLIQFAQDSIVIRAQEITCI